MATVAETQAAITTAMTAANATGNASGSAFIQNMPPQFTISDVAAALADPAFRQELGNKGLSKTTEASLTKDLEVYQAAELAWSGTKQGGMFGNDAGKESLHNSAEIITDANHRVHKNDAIYNTMVQQNSSGFKALQAMPASISIDDMHTALANEHFRDKLVKANIPNTSELELQKDMQVYWDANQKQLIGTPEGATYHSSPVKDAIPLLKQIVNEQKAKDQHSLNSGPAVIESAQAEAQEPNATVETVPFAYNYQSPKSQNPITPSPAVTAPSIQTYGSSSKFTAAQIEALNNVGITVPSHSSPSAPIQVTDVTQIGNTAHTFFDPASDEPHIDSEAKEFFSAPANTETSRGITGSQSSVPPKVATGIVTTAPQPPQENGWSADLKATRDTSKTTSASFNKTEAILKKTEDTYKEISSKLDRLAQEFDSENLTPTRLPHHKTPSGARAAGR